MNSLILLAALSTGQCEAGVCTVTVEAEVCQPVRSAVKAVVVRQPARSVARAVISRQPVRSVGRFVLERQPVRRVLFAPYRRCR